MAESYYKDIIAIRSEIDKYLGMEAIEKSSIPLWLVMHGENISIHNVTLGLLNSWVTKLKGSMCRIGSRILEESITISKDAERQCDFVLHPKLLAGSVQIGLRLKDVQPDLFAGYENPYYKPLEGLLKASKIISAEPRVEELRMNFSSEEEESMYLEEVLTLTPSKKGNVSQISFTGALIPSEKPIILTDNTRKYIKSMYTKITENEIEEFEGVFREIDLDKTHTILRSRPDGMPDLLCKVSKQTIEEAANALNKRVRVTGTMHPKKPNVFKVHSFNLVEE